MQVMESSISRLAPRMQTRVYRNHFDAQSPQMASAYVESTFNRLRGVDIIDVSGPAQKASEWLQTYRYNIVNAIFNEKVLAGDDLSVLEDTDDWE